MRWLELNLDDLYAKYLKKNKINKSIQTHKKDHELSPHSHDEIDEEEDIKSPMMAARIPIGSCAHKQKFKEKLFSHAE